MNSLPNLQRRRCLAFITALCGTAMPVVTRAHAAIPTRLAAAWEGLRGYQVGVLEERGHSFLINGALDVPTRAHGVWVETGGTLLAVARRPGDWLLRWRPGSKSTTWSWIDPDRAFNGHVIVSLDGTALYTTETNLETGQGLIGVRDVASLEKTGEIPTHGMDPHELLVDADGSLLVANGGIPTLPETGRLKIGIDRMDSSLVRLDTRSGALLGQWRLADRRLSLRHIDWGPRPAGSAVDERLLGVALQAEHDDASTRAASPVLAIFDGRQLQCVATGSDKSLAGYGGDITYAAGGFAVSCPRANGVAIWRDDGQWIGFYAMEEACALTAAPNAGQSRPLWVGGRMAARIDESDGMTFPATLEDVRLDNHWMPMVSARCEPLTRLRQRHQAPLPCRC